MKMLLCIAALLVVQRVQTYVLLTANLDDVEAAAKQLVQSPAMAKLQQHVSRAVSNFDQQMRSIDDEEVKKLTRSPVLGNMVKVLRHAYLFVKQKINEVNPHSDVKRDSSDDSRELASDDHYKRRRKINTHMSRREDGKEAVPLTEEQRQEKLRVAKEMVALGKNVTRNLNSIKGILSASV